MKKIIVFAMIYGGMLSLAILFREPLLDWLNQSNYQHLPIMFLLSITFGIIPIVPFSVFAALMGVKYGIIIGAAINWFGSVGAAIVFFLLSRRFFLDRFQRWVQHYKKIKKLDDLLRRNAFIAILFARILPIVPPPVINIYSGLSSMSFMHYSLATAIGQIPGMVIYAYLGNHLFTSIQTAFLGLLFYIVFISIVVGIYWWWYHLGEKQRHFS